jgi:SAM-dependent methyltransferase
MSFLDLFSGHAGEYATARPCYPAALFDAVAAASPGLGRVWDCACGNGQASLGLAQHFDRVEASDASAAQIAQAQPDPRVRYTVQAAERTDYADASFDAVCVAQALHWFDFAPFFAEVRRVLRPRGVFLAWGYHRFHVTPAFDAAFELRVERLLAPYWAAQNTLLWNGYRDVPRPAGWEPVTLPPLAIEADWTLQQLLAYVLTWSASQRCLAADGRGWFERAEADLALIWGNADAVRRVTMPLVTFGGRFVDPS